MKRIITIAAVLFLVGCAHQGRENYNAQHNPAATTPNEYAQQMREYMSGAMAGIEHGKTCYIALKYDVSGLLMDVKSQGGDPALCSQILHYMTDPRYPVPAAPAEMRSAPIVLDFNS
ncbi:cell envelope integrity TolA C-terminal domain-containing protein [Enterobacter sp. FR 78]|uniref:cell envelope integrity TolA C-terminal domain-containing protein n=1 Tax=Enterobacter sp. FR 78 TaxID=3021714 RepID=UPI0023A94020|nr:cell envelope integrity TolA C-terminal domain-containing protein [Enterobacter sp. FR 78]MDD9580504.1 cell envelope integrity TolA C-terminal domain-containing protein [Enterobacter sp. FR 78]